MGEQEVPLDQETIGEINELATPDIEWRFKLTEMTNKAKYPAYDAFDPRGSKEVKQRALAELIDLGFNPQVVTEMNRRRDWDNPVSVARSIELLVDDWARRNYGAENKED